MNTLNELENEVYTITLSVVNKVHVINLLDMKIKKKSNTKVVIISILVITIIL